MTANVRKNSGTQSADKALCKRRESRGHGTRPGRRKERKPRARTCLERAHNHDGPVVLPGELEQPQHAQRLEHGEVEPRRDGVQVERHDREEVAPKHDVARNVQKALRCPGSAPRGGDRSTSKRAAREGRRGSRARATEPRTRLGDAQAHDELDREDRVERDLENVANFPPVRGLELRHRLRRATDGSARDIRGMGTGGGRFGARRLRGASGPASRAR